MLVTLGFIGILAFEGVLDSGSVEAATTRYVGQGQTYTTIGAAITAANAGDTIRVYAGTYKENLQISKSLTLIGNGTINTTIDGSANGDVIQITADWVNITGFTVTNSGSLSGDAGIDVYWADHCKIESCNFSNNGYYGIYLAFSSDDEVSNCTVNSNRMNGIRLNGATDSIFKNNICDSNTYTGINVDTGSRNTIFNNTCSNSRDGIYIRQLAEDNVIEECTFNQIYGYGIYIVNSERHKLFNNSMFGCGILIIGNGQQYIDSHEVDTNNTVNNNPVYFWKNTTGGVIPVNAGQVILANCSNVVVENQNCSNGSLGIHLSYSDNCTIRNNTCNTNLRGIYITRSDFNKVENNLCNWNSGEGIYVYSSYNTTIANCSASQNDDDGIFVTTLEHITITNCTANWNNYHGIFTMGTDYNTISNNICNYNAEHGIYLATSGSTIINNTCNWDVESGIYVRGASRNDKLINNSMLDCGIRMSGNNVLDWNTHIIDTSNTVNNKPVYYRKNMTAGTIPAGAGQVILANCSSIVVENQNCSDGSVGATLGFSNNNKIRDITSNSNIWGIYLYHSGNNEIINSTCNLNYNHGIEVINSNNNVINNCTANRNFDDGINIYYLCSSSNISNCSTNNNNGDGIELYHSSSTKIDYNICSKNGNGTRLDSNSKNNIILRNIISNNNDNGIYIPAGCDNNRIYHNDIVTNINQALDAGNNIWNNNQLEGNYWSDYAGLDNGAGGRVPGDGIGDTNIPHPGVGYDNYPLMNPFRWRYLDSPILVDPGELSLDGSYLLTWNLIDKATGYIVEEDIDRLFSSPVIIYDGSELLCNFAGKENGTYFYRVRAYNVFTQSQWSNNVNITVDYPPDAPTGLLAVAQGINITLTWSPNSEPDIEGYNILMNNTGEGEFGLFHWIYTVPSSITEWIITHLVEDTIYYFVITAFDRIYTNSTYSNVAFAITTDVTPPKAPTGLKAEAIAGSKIKLSWNPNTEPDLAGYNILMKEDRAPATTFNIIHTIIGTSTKYTVPDLFEETKYNFKINAFDEVPNNSSFSKVVSATTPDTTRPEPPYGVTVSEPTSESLKIFWEANLEPDVIGYIIYRSGSASGSFNAINDEPLTDTQFVDTGLVEATTYYYKLRAIDDADLESEFSELAFGTTLLDPYAPEVNNSIADFEILEDSYDDTSLNLYYWFKDLNGDILTFRCEGQEHIDLTIHQENGTVILMPEENWNGKEELTFYASDKLFEVSDQVIITVAPVNDPPNYIEILTPIDGYNIKEGEYLTFNGAGDDPDVPYGDKLTFEWSSNISGVLGEGVELENVSLIPGVHLITLEVTDEAGESVTAEIQIKCTKEDETTKDKDGETKPAKREDNSGVIIVALIIIAIVVIIVLVFYFRFRKKQTPNEAKDQVESQAPTHISQPPPQQPQTHQPTQIPKPSQPPPTQPRATTYSYSEKPTGEEVVVSHDQPSLTKNQPETAIDRVTEGSQRNY